MMLGTFKSNSAQGSGLLTVVGTASYASPSTSSTSHTIPIPEGSPGDILVVFAFAVQNGVTLTPSAGWSIIYSTTVDSSDPYYILQRTAVSDTDLILSASVSTRVSAVVYRFANATTVESTTSVESAFDNTITFPAHTAAAGDRFVWVRSYSIQKAAGASTWLSAPSGYGDIVQCVGNSAITQTASKENTTAIEGASTVNTSDYGLVTYKVTTTLVVY